MLFIRPTLRIARTGCGLRCQLQWPTQKQQCPGLMQSPIPSRRTITTEKISEAESGAESHGAMVEMEQSVENQWRDQWTNDNSYQSDSGTGGRYEDRSRRGPRPARELTPADLEMIERQNMEREGIAEENYQRMVKSVDWKTFGIKSVPPRIIKHARIIPVSPSYFSRQPTFNESYLRLHNLLRNNAHLPTMQAEDVKRVAWRSFDDYSRMTGEEIKLPLFNEAINLAKRLHRIRPSLRPEAVSEALSDFLRPSNPYDRVKPVRVVDKFGRSLGMGRRKTSTARAWVVEGTGECLINGKTLSEAFGRVHDRESATWPLRVTERMDKYNIWALVDGGGTTGQAEALTLAIARALSVHEPGLTNALRRGKQGIGMSNDGGRIFCLTSYVTIVKSIQPSNNPPTFPK
ncbi:uncharacterized protein MKZ38_002533 [Zalerion maritima]|uniref:Ribosomal protein S5 n=1 Tax=Zalerion maritima TaxID=339359 RepID=A0AAD5WQQ7_9PEZI|nr:uncharacterized protein MKZ38_002533 [Zalerion maritima]